MRQSEEERRELNRQRAREYQRKLRLENPDFIKEKKRQEWIKIRETRPDKHQEIIKRRREWHRKWVILNPDKAKEENRKVALRWKQTHPEIGTHQNPNITEENRLKGLKNLTYRYPKGCQINKGRVSKLRGRKRDPEIIEKIAVKQRGKKRGPLPEETRRKLSESHRKRYEGKDRTIAKENRFIREGIEIKLWREAVFRRDNWTCVTCGKRGARLHADHIKPFAYFPELRFDLNNGRTLCVPCHRKTDTYGEGAKKLAKKLNLTRADTSHPNPSSEPPA